MNLINYNYFEKCEFKDYKIDDKRNEQILNLFQEFVLDTKDSGITYQLTGSLALAFLTGKIYRTWRDVDILTDEVNFIDILNSLPVNKWMYTIFDRFHLKILNCKYSPKLKLEILIPSDFDIQYETVLFEVKNQIFIPIIKPQNILQWKRTIKNERSTDIDDIEFYSKII